MRQGFSLVELSIVLVILGLLVGGILAGKSLIHAAELRNIAKQYDQYRSAMFTFKDKYFSIPGDFIDATKFWPTKTNCTTDTNTAATCDGNSDGELYYGKEGWLFWQHMALAGLLEGSFTGTRGPGGAYDAIPGTNVPPTGLNNTFWNTYHIGTSAGNANFIAGEYGNPLWIINASNEGLIPEDAWNIDSKIDDGQPSFGKLLAYRYGGCITTSTANPFPDAVYKLTATTPSCGLIFPLAIR